MTLLDQLRSLGTTPDEVAHSLHAAGVTGYPTTRPTLWPEHERDPLANWLIDVCRYADARVEADEIVTWDDPDCTHTVADSDVPSAIADFVIAFDHGSYGELAA